MGSRAAGSLRGEFRLLAARTRGVGERRRLEEDASAGLFVRHVGSVMGPCALNSLAVVHPDRGPVQRSTEERTPADPCPLSVPEVNIADDRSCLHNCPQSPRAPGHSRAPSLALSGWRKAVKALIQLHTQPTPCTANDAPKPEPRNSDEVEIALWQPDRDPSPHTPSSFTTTPSGRKTPGAPNVALSFSPRASPPRVATASVPTAI